MNALTENGFQWLNDQFEDEDDQLLKQCDICNKWIHIKCNYLDKKSYAFFQNPNNEAETFICICCMADNVPFSKLNNNEFSISVKNGILNTNDCQMNFVPSDYQQKVFDTLNSAISNNAFDLDNEDESDGDPIPTIDWKYYSIDDFKSF